MQNPFLERYGGAKGVSRIVFRFYDLVLDSKRLHRFFEGIDMPRLIEHQTAVIVSVLGGKRALSRRDIVLAHAHLDIAPEDFDEMIELLKKAVTESGMSKAEYENLVRFYADFRMDLVRTRGAAAPA